MDDTGEFQQTTQEQARDQFFGPQQQPASVGRVHAQWQQTLREAALKGVTVDAYGWPVDDQNFDLYLRQFREAEQTQKNGGTERDADL